jgi:hypothetical protein
VKYVHLILISDLWEKYHRKEFIKAISKELSQWSDVVIVQLPISLFIHPFTNFKRFFLKLKDFFRTRNIESGGLLFTPMILFHYLLWDKFNLFFKIDYLLLNYQLRKIARNKFGEKQLALWVFFPFLCKFVKKFKSKSNYIIYDQYDLYNYNVEGNKSENITEKNNSLIGLSDLVFCTTKFIYDYSKKINNNSYYITNGNNFHLLNKKNDCKTTTGVTDKKIVGYLGGIRDWLDFELLKYLIKNLRDVNFIFIGQIYNSAKQNMKELLKIENVQWYDFIPIESLNIFMTRFSVGLIPFKTSEFFAGVFPNKFYEYMALGIPIVTTGLPELIGYKEIIGYSETKEEFLSNTKSALNGDYNKFKDNYIKTAMENSWDKKAILWNNILKNNIKN